MPARQKTRTRTKCPLPTASQSTSDRVNNTARVLDSWSGVSFHKGSFLVYFASFFFALILEPVWFLFVLA